MANLDQWNFLICLYNNYFGSFQIALSDLTAISILSFMNNSKRTYFNFGTKFARVCNFGSRSSIPSTLFKVSMSDLPNFIKIEGHFCFWTKFVKFIILDQDHQFQLIYS